MHNGSNRYLNSQSGTVSKQRNLARSTEQRHSEAPRLYHTHLMIPKILRVPKCGTSTDGTTPLQLYIIEGHRTSPVAMFEYLTEYDGREREPSITLPHFPIVEPNKPSLISTVQKLTHRKTNIFLSPSPTPFLATSP